MIGKFVETGQWLKPELNKERIHVQLSSSICPLYSGTYGRSTSIINLRRHSISLHAAFFKIVPFSPALNAPVKKTGRFRPARYMDSQFRYKQTR